MLLGLVGIPAGGTGSATRPALRSALRPVVLRMGLVAALGWGCLSGLSFLVALRLEEQFALGAGARGLVLTGLGVAGLLSARLVGAGVDAIGARRSVLLGAGLGALVVARGRAGAGGVGWSPRCGRSVAWPPSSCWSG